MLQAVPKQKTTASQIAYSDSQEMQELAFPILLQLRVRYTSQ
ncbi:hypothetical protein CAter10_1833 [Collimonas arenae]|nr:hypothetical protein CAter10_1833 [Collimonas arenae]